MSFQAYLDNIELKTGKTPLQFIDEATEKGFGKDTKAGEIVQWLAEDYELGRGHAMALVHVIKHGAEISEKHINSRSTHSDSGNKLNLEGRQNTPKPPSS